MLIRIDWYGYGIRYTVYGIRILQVYVCWKQRERKKEREALFFSCSFILSLSNIFTNAHSLFIYYPSLSFKLISLPLSLSLSFLYLEYQWSNNINYTIRIGWRWWWYYPELVFRHTPVESRACYAATVTEQACPGSSQQQQQQQQQRKTTTAASNHHNINSSNSSNHHKNNNHRISVPSTCHPGIVLLLSLLLFVVCCCWFVFIFDQKNRQNKLFEKAEKIERERERDDKRVSFVNFLLHANCEHFTLGLQVTLTLLPPYVRMPIYTHWI